MIEKNVVEMESHWKTVDTMLEKGGALLPLDNLAGRDDGLLRFLVPSEAPLVLLVINGAAYLPKLRTMLPAAEIHAVTSDSDIAASPLYAELDIIWEILDWQTTRLPYPLGMFDYILADFCLELAANPQDIASGFGYYIKDTGYLLTSFENVRHWKTVEALKDGHFYSIVRHPFTTAEMETLLAASFYKSVSFSAIHERAPEDVLKHLVEAGFHNAQDDLEVRYWRVKARRSMDEVALLKEYFTPEVRRLLVTYLRRLEYDIDAQATSVLLWRLVVKEDIFPDYLAGFIAETIVYRQTLLENLIKTGELQFLQDLLEALYRLLPEDQGMLENLAKMLMAHEEK